MSPRRLLRNSAVLLAVSLFAAVPVSAHASDDDTPDSSMPAPQVPTPPAQTPPSPPSPPSSQAPAPTSPPRPPQPDEGVVRRLKDELKAAKRAVESSSLAEGVKKALYSRLERLEKRVGLGDVSVSADIAAIVAEVRAAAVPPSQPSTPLPTPSTPPPPSTTKPGVPQPDASTPSTSPVSTVPSPSSTQPRREEGSREVAKKLAELRVKVAKLPASPEQAATLARIDALTAAVAQGVAVTRADVVVLEGAVRALLEAAEKAKKGGDSQEKPEGVEVDDDTLPVPGVDGPPQSVPAAGTSSLLPQEGSPEGRSRRAEREAELDAQRQARLSGSVAEGLAQLAAFSGPEADAARAAFMSLNEQLVAGVAPSREQVEAARKLFGAATEWSPVVRAAVALAGAVSAVEASQLPLEVRTALLEQLQSAKGSLVNDPSLDPAVVVSQALDAVRQARIAAAAERVSALAAKVKDAASAAANEQALALASDAEKTASGALSRDDLRAARDLIRQALVSLRGTVPTSVPATSVPGQLSPDPATSPSTTVAP